MEGTHSADENGHDVLVAFEHATQVVPDLGLDLESVDLVGPQELGGGARQGEQSVEDEQEDGVVAIEKVVRFVGGVFEP